MTKTIIWIEDDYHIIGSLVQPLEDNGYKVVKYSSYREAMKNINNIKKADLILLDIILPSGDGTTESRFYGIRLLQDFRKNGIDKPVIALTVVTNESVINRLKGLNVESIITKPFLPSDLKELVNETLSP